MIPQQQHLMQSPVIDRALMKQYTIIGSKILHLTLHQFCEMHDRQLISPLRLLHFLRNLILSSHLGIAFYVTTLGMRDRKSVV